MTPYELIGRVPDLPSLPEVYFQVDRVLQDPDFSLQELSEVIEREPAIAARLLRLANSALYGFSGHIDTIQRAVTMIGSDEIRDLILSSAVLSAFKRMPVGAVSMRSFWEHSIACGLAARNIAALTGAANMQRYYIYGLLHDIGRLVLQGEIALNRKPTQKHKDTI
ncbi:MAG: HDOD domain-containing protein [Candidatus Sedimenticola endophacoides]